MSLYDAVALSAELGEGFERVDEAREVHATPWGSDQAFTWVLCRRGVVMSAGEAEVGNSV